MVVSESFKRSMVGWKGNEVFFYEQPNNEKKKPSKKQPQIPNAAKVQNQKHNLHNIHTYLSHSLNCMHHSNYFDLFY